MVENLKELRSEQLGKAVVMMGGVVVTGMGSVGLASAGGSLTRGDIILDHEDYGL